LNGSIHPLSLPPFDDGEEFSGAFATEAESAAEFDRVVAASGLFDSSPEVDGFYLSARIHRAPKTARIDRILFPTKKLRAAGWHQPFGVELKRSGEKLGPALCQAIDYTYAAFEVRGVFVALPMIFLWPLVMPKRSAQSVMVHNGVGAAYVDKRGALRFESERTLIYSLGDELRVSAHVAGRKVGSR
jgi:hypothetical protein